MGRLLNWWDRQPWLGLMLVGALFIGLGGVSLAYALPQKTTVHSATVTDEEYETNYSSHSNQTKYNITLQVDGVGKKVADDRAFYRARSVTGSRPHVTVTMYGGRVKNIIYAGKTYSTELAPQSTEIIELVVFWVIGLVLVGIGFRRKLTGHR
jgi:hypothetical protein